MSNPRKFSEKIALHNQKQAEETAAFEQIMREVSGATRAPITVNHHQPSYQNQLLYINPPLGAYRGGSLPNVNQIGNNAIDLQNALDNLESMKQGHECLSDRIQRERSRHISHRNRISHYEKRRDASPYEATTYLSPPPDTSWRRTNSDSALHQSATTPLENSPLGSINNLYLSNPCANNAVTNHRYSPTTNIDTNLLSDKNYWDNKQSLQSPSSPHRPKSCEVPGISIYPSQEENNSGSSPTSHVPISSSTGSLPDLTNLHFPSPLATPLDSDQDQMCYSVNDPLQENHNALTAPSMVSRTNHQHHHHQQQQLDNNSISVLNSDNSSRQPQQQQQQQQQQSQQSLLNGIHVASNQLQPQSPDARSSPLRESSSRLSNLIIQNPKVSSQVSSSAPMQYSPMQQDTLSQYGIYQEDLMTSMTGTQGMSGSYRGRSSSPGGNSSCSAPTSPVSPSSSPGLDSSNYNKNAAQQNNFFVQQQQQQTNALQHQFEHFNMLQDQGTTATTMNNGLYMGSSGNDRTMNRDAVMTMSENNIFYVSSPSSTNNGQLSSHPPPYNNSNSVISRINQSDLQTPSTLPEIILTAPGADETMLRQDFVKDLGHAMASLSGSFESELFAGADEALRAGLDPIDFDGLQILTDPDIPIDPATEETFRNERL